MKEKFYVFLDIDGVLNDLQYMQSLDKKQMGIVKVNPRSVDALNYLVEKLSVRYDVEIVVSSTWRSNMIETLVTLVNNGFKKENVSVTRTGDFFTPHYRGREILKYLENKKNNDNYVVIDDETFDFKECIPIRKVIKTSFYTGGLDKKMIDSFFEKLEKKKR